jgi:glutathione peroxidase
MAPAFTSLLPAATSAAASRLPSAAAGAASTFARLPHHPTGWAGASVAAPRTAAARRRAPGVAYATAATDKSIYDYTVKVASFLLFC